MCCTRLTENTGRKESPFWHHCTTLSGCIFAAEACIDNRKKNLLNTDTSSTCPRNMVNFGLLTAEISWRVWGTPTNFNGFRILAAQRYCAHSSSGRQPNFVALNRGRHLNSAERPSRCALAHILVVDTERGSLCSIVVCLHTCACMYNLISAPLSLPFLFMLLPLLLTLSTHHSHHP